MKVANFNFKSKLRILNKKDLRCMYQRMERLDMRANRENIMPDEKIAEIRGVRNMLNPEVEEEEKHEALKAEQKRIHIINNRENSVRQIRCKSKINFFPSSEKLKRLREASQEKPEIFKGKIVSSKMFDLYINLKQEEKQKDRQMKKERSDIQNKKNGQEKQMKEKGKQIQQYLQNSIRKKQYLKPNRIQEMRNFDSRRFQKTQQFHKNMRQ